MEKRSKGKKVSSFILGDEILGKIDMLLSDLISIDKIKKLLLHMEQHLIVSSIKN